MKHGEHRENGVLPRWEIAGRGGAGRESGCSSAFEQRERGLAPKEGQGGLRAETFNHRGRQGVGEAGSS